MRVLAAILLLCLGLAGGAAHAVDLDPNVQATKADQVRELFSEGVKLYRIGRYDEAALRLKDALLLQPEDQLVYEFYLAMGDVLLMDMREKAELEEVMDEILRVANVYRERLRNDPRYIELLIGKLAASEKERLAATTELVAVGPIAVPYLVDRLADSRQDDYRVWSRMVLSRMGYRAVVPLTEALNSADERQVHSVATILADIGDPRALPKLQQLATDETSTETTMRVCRNAIAAIAARSDLVAIDEAPMLYFQEALRYFRDGDQVRDELIANESLMWRWQEDAVGSADRKPLQWVKVPRYAWNELMAEELLFDLQHHYPAFGASHALLAATLAAQDVEARLRLRLAEQRTDPPGHPDEAIDALQERVDALAEMRDRVALAGPHLFRALQQSIVSERYDTAIYLMRLLRDNWIADPEDLLPSKEEGLMADKLGTVLIAALEHPEKRIRYNAAITLAHLDPKVPVFNGEKVVPLLAEAVGEWGMHAVLVVEPDYRHRNAARAALMQQGILAFTANDGFQARQRINETPVKDAIVIAGDLTPALRDEHGVVIDVPEQTAMGLVEVFKQDPRTEQTPVFISLPENKELAVKIQNAFDGKVDGFVQRPYNGVEMKGKIELALGDAQLPDLNREERERISLEACKALESVDPVRTQFPIADAADALAATAENRADEIRVHALRALGQTGASHKADHIVAVYQNQADVLVGKPEVRAAFIYCIGLLDPATEAATRILLDACQAEDDLVRTTAHEAAGHGAGIPVDVRREYHKQQRLDVRAAGAGQWQE